jgi:hypothetical protein
MDYNRREKRVAFTLDDRIDKPKSTATTAIVRSDLSESLSESSTMQIADRSVLRYLQSHFLQSSTSLAATQFSDDSGTFDRDLDSNGLDQGAAIRSAELEQADTSIYFASRTPLSATSLNSLARVKNPTETNHHLRDRLFFQSQLLPIDESLQGATHRVIQDFVAIGLEHHTIVHEGIIPKEAQLRQIESEIEHSCAAIETTNRKIARCKSLLDKQNTAQSYPGKAAA